MPLEDDLLNLLSPYMGAEPERRAQIVRAFGVNNPFINHLKSLTGATDVFVPNLIYDLRQYGEYPEGTPALWTLVESILKQTGSRQERFERLRRAIYLLCDNQNELSALSRLEQLRRSRDEMYTIQARYLEYLREYPPYSGQGDRKAHERIIDDAKDTCRRAEDPDDDRCREARKFHAHTPEFKTYKADCQNTLSYIAELRLTRSFVTGDSESDGEQQRREVEQWGKYEDRNLSALSDAIERLKTLIAKETGDAAK